MREAGGAHQHQAFGVTGAGGFHSSVWRSAEHVDNALRNPVQQQFAKLEARKAQHSAMQQSACD